MNRKKINGLLTILLVNVLIFGLAYLVLNAWAEWRLPPTRAQYLDPESASFYRRYTSRLNHLRSFDFPKLLSPEIATSVTDLLFSKVGNQGDTVLIQGDSWAEQFLISSGSYFALETFAETNDANFIVAGVSSYSPSPMAVQYEILRKDFQVRPAVVVGTIDQTDIGDEVCRYRPQLAADANGEYLKPYDGPELMPYSVLPYFRMIDILEGEGSPLVRLLKYKLEKLKSQPPGGCSGEEILSALKGKLTASDREYFISRVERYINVVLTGLDSAGTLILVTHFHRHHFDGQYTVNVGNLVADAISRSPFRDRVVHIDFKPQDYQPAVYDTMFLSGDAYSHLTNYQHRRSYTQQILVRVKQALLKYRSGNPPR